MAPLTILVALALTLAACGSSSPKAKGGGGGSGSSTTTITVGSANFAEDEILAYIYAGALTHAGFKATVKELTTRTVIIPALKAGQLDIEPDYAASLLAYLHGTPSSDIGVTTSRLYAKLRGTDLGALPAADAVDTNGFAVTRKTAQRYHLSTLSSLKPYAHNFTLGAAPECSTYYYCLPGLKRVYGLHFKSVLSLDAGGPITRNALVSGHIQVGELFTTDPTINQLGLVLLQDDKHLQASDDVIPIVKKSVLSTKLITAIDAVQHRLTTSVLRQLNGGVVLQHATPQQVASGFLSAIGM
jgi:osmoprotectant transport system substrate-binding protein